ncbi:hypothetical protein IMZ16_04870 [Cruoricaptor ignavus]|uniref:Uncharacterized protein n=1 Tax=Cruoricaptor ignavus TaxID=1118202 RepID=A0A7M1T6N1_9FLAO|nr:hypothetical protein [Cruoricaptor ignavus]QOR74754.1 hypothetical protein IMZ16_04870 [Cruoricaptor ignavus]
MGKVTRYRSVLSYAKHCISEQQHPNRREFTYRILFRQLPAPTSSLPSGEWANDLVTELLHKSTLSALYLIAQTTEISCEPLSFPFTYPQSSP